jgi:23S rRNA (uracil1939-C5)-methyltransferase
VETELVIRSVNADGDGVGMIDGASATLPGTIPGERVSAEMQRARDGSLSGEVVRILAASPHRVTPRCRHFGPCGGCAWQHIEYGEQLRIKQERVQELIADRGSKDPRDGSRAAERRSRVLPTLATPSPDGGTPWWYRNKVSFVFGPGGRGQSVVMGHYRRGSRTVLAVAECPVHAEAGNRFAFEVRDALRRAGVPGATPDAQEGVARHVVVRVSEGTGELLGTLVVTENVKALRRVTADVEARVAPASPDVRQPRRGFHLNVHDRPDPFLFGRETRRLFGTGEIREQVAGVSYLVSPTAFFQTNVRAAEVLVRVVLDALSDTRLRRVLDLYAGVGLFAIPLARSGRAVTAVEENRQAVSSATTALRLNGIDQGACRLIASRVEDAVARSPAQTWDAVVLDPPRQGCPPGVLDRVFRTLQPARIVYVSCDPEALARDLARVTGTGYHLERVQPIDMFPHTAHIETVAVLQRTRRDGQLPV